MLTLVPAGEEWMPFRQSMLEDPATMAYNAPYFPPDGTIPFPESKWAGWLERWTGREPERFCGYVLDGDTPVGEVCWHGMGSDMGVVIRADYRGQGYGREALGLLMARAFGHAEIAYLRNTFETDRDPAMRLHLSMGFVPVGTEDGLTVVEMTRERYVNRYLTRTGE